MLVSVDGVPSEIIKGMMKHQEHGHEGSNCQSEIGQAKLQINWKEKMQQGFQLIVLLHKRLSMNHKTSHVRSNG